MKYLISLIYAALTFFSVVYFILSNKSLIFPFLGGLNVTTGCAHATTSKSSSVVTKGYTFVAK